MANLRTVKEEQKKNRSGQGGKKRKKHLTGNKKSTPKKDMKIAQLREVYPGIYGNKKTVKMLKELGIDPAELIKKSASGISGSSSISDKH